MMDIPEVFAGNRVLPVIVSDDAANAPALARALVDGGITVAEVTFRTPSAPSVLQTMAQQPDLTVGAGTVLTVEQVDTALAAGARFIVSPGLDPDVIRYCQRRRVPVLPGVATASEIIAAIHCGLEAVKIFPVAQLGGPDVVRALAAPFPDLGFVPTGGVDESTLASYLRHDRVLAVGGSWMATTAMIEGGAWSDIVAACARTVALTATTSTPGNAH
jgi:2-dehydro-3-deoxyphosphogluconate aldolase/(4S)-4-hydroxy-2-oxoglutarate aldolase